MPNTAWSIDSPADAVAQIVAALAAVPSLPDMDVFDGRADQGAHPPFVCCWQLGPEVHGVALAAESFGVFHQQWQFSPHGATQGQARIMAEAITTHNWPDTWEFVESGPLVEDTTDIPGTFFYPVTFVYRGM